jgi:hypothetical protein
LVGHRAYFDLFLLLSPIARNSPANQGLGSSEIIANPKSKIQNLKSVSLPAKWASGWMR